MRSLLFLAPAILASPLVKRYDLDGNGTPDWCNELGNGKAECMYSGAWTTIPSTVSATVADTTCTSVSAKTTDDGKVQVTSSWTAALTSATATPTAKAKAPAAKLPDDPNQFKSDNGTKWKLEFVPGTDAKQDLGDGAVYSNTVSRLGWDKGRTSSIDGRVFWNFGDCMSVDGLEKGSAAGFSMGAAFYGSVEKPLMVNMTGFTTVQNENFAQPFTGKPNPDPVPPQDAQYGMDTSNTAQVAPGKGIGFAWEIFRTPAEGDIKDLGSAMFEVTLGDEKPIATRKRDLITDGSKIQIGLMTVFNPNLKNSPNANGYLYMYTTGAGMWDSIIVGRVKVESAFDPTKYQFMKMNGTWDAEGVIPTKNDTSYGMEGKPVSNNQGSIMWNDYLQKYTLFTGQLGHTASFSTSDNPWGPWSKPYQLITLPNLTYGANVHPDLLPSSDGKELLFSWGTAAIQTMYKITFNY